MEVIGIGFEFGMKIVFGGYDAYIENSSHVALNIFPLDDIYYNIVMYNNNIRVFVSMIA